MLRRRPTLLALVGLGARPARAQTGPQPRLPEEPLVIVTREGTRHAFRVEVVTEPAQQMVGLMFRDRVGPDEGMLFDWGLPQRDSSMWMRNTLVPLDMLFIAQGAAPSAGPSAGPGAGGRVHRIAERTVPLSLAAIDSRGPVRATLELAGGTAERLVLRVGDRVEHRIFGVVPG